MSARIGSRLPILLVTMTAVGCDVVDPLPDVASPALSVSVVGTWALRSVAEAARMQLELAFDSAVDSSFRGRVVFLMQGDVGIDPSLFHPGRRVVVGDTLVQLELRATSPAVPPSRITGHLLPDTIRLREFVWAGEDGLVTGPRFVLVRQRGAPTETETKRNTRDLTRMAVERVEHGADNAARARQVTGGAP